VEFVCIEAGAPLAEWLKKAPPEAGWRQVYSDAKSDNGEVRGTVIFERFLDKPH